MLLQLLRRSHYSSLAARTHGVSLAERVMSLERDSMSNVGPSIVAKLDRRLFADDAHPVGIVKHMIWDYFRRLPSTPPFECFDHFDPVVTVQQNFDALCFPRDHVGRSRSDSYFFNNERMLRTHMTANEPEYIRAGKRAFLVAGDVYRRDEIDSTHYPVFHQLEGVRIVDEDWRLADADLPAGMRSPLEEMHGVRFDHERQDGHDCRELRLVTDDLYHKLSGLMRHLFGPAVPIRWQTCFFPFTCPSFEIEVLHRGRWMEVCGSGVLQRSILQDCGAHHTGWAFGLGLERLAMILFDIPDIRLFWSDDARFSSQFKPGQVNTFVPFSRHPLVNRDMSFWLGDAEGGFDLASFCDLIRQLAGDLVESVKLIDTFVTDSKRTSHCYRITYRAIDRTLTDEEVNAVQDRIRLEASRQFGIVLR